MHLTVNIILACLVLASCATAEPDRYKDITALERPPTLAPSQISGEAQEIEESSNTAEEETAGLGDKVYMTDTNSPALRIKQSFDETWITLERVLTQLDLKVTDQNREEKVYYVKFDADDYQPEDDSLFNKMTFSVFSNDYVEQSYKLKFEDLGSETEITAETVDKADENYNADSKEGDLSESSADGSGHLLKKIYKSLHDEFKTE